MSDTKRVLNPEITLCVYALAPVPSKTPWWARKAKLTYSHICLSLEDVVWEQGMGQLRGVRGRALRAGDWARSAFSTRRAFKAVAVEFTATPQQMQAFRQAAQDIAKRKSQPLRTVLRYLGLWPVPAWNCTSPVRVLFGALGHTLKGELPDDLIREIEALSADSDCFDGVAGRLG